MADLLSEILSAISRFTPSSAFDIGIVTLLFYGILMLVRGTRADQVLRGIILLFIFFSIVATAFHLTMVDWLLRNSPLVLLVALPIIFQPELRRALEQVGRTSALINRPLATLSTPLQPSSVDEIMSAVGQLTERRYGALIVLEGNTGLEDFVRSGTRIDGELSSDLIMSTFFPHSPMHDGAVIVRGDRVLAAGCVLPLSDNQAAMGHGTRHRAAVGITEQTDAACIVVSEETGTVSLARAGNLTVNMGVDRLSHFLRAFYHTHSQTTSNTPQLTAVGGG